MSSALTTFLFVLFSLHDVRCDEARAIIADNVARSHQEAVPPEVDDHDAISSDGPIVSPIHPGDRKSYLDLLNPKAHGHEIPQRFPFIRMDFSKAKPLVITLWILIASLAKFGEYRIIYLDVCKSFYPDEGLSGL